MILPIASLPVQFRAQSIYLHRGKRQILKDVSLSLSPGECVAIVGPNGAGKSSLLKIFSGDLSPQSGEVTLANLPVTSWNRGDLCRRRAVLPQQSELLFSFSVREVVLMGREPHHSGIATAKDERIVDEAMEATDVFQFHDRPYDQLSGGEKQRVQLARVLAQVWPEPNKPSGFLLLDEPTSGLDLSHQQALLEIVQDFSHAGLGILVVFHDLNLALQYADRVMVLYHGHSVACGPPEEALTPTLIREVFDVEMELMRPHPLSCPVLVPIFSGHTHLH